MIVPTLCVGMPQWTLCVRFGTQSVPGCIPTRSVGTITVTKPRSAPFSPSPAPHNETAAHANQSPDD
ncbi:hypothetical protein C1X59_14930 [Pseudomonas sp. FW215-R2]|nr:hypothetical protein C1X59_14930 [Pseudomonas sp. FW215-R2]PMX10341.1 hypothetical protein C1X60_10495 [Pseudomonas sp. FW215-L1]PMX24048.1 hypothetical protein C1X57_09095 [Pseudomonas sp. FW215-E1]PNA31317.1 hypothetical protein C1X58_07890 [Pseudomonas sp. FW215-R4]